MKKIQFYCSVMVLCLLVACGGTQSEEVTQEEVTADAKPMLMENPLDAMSKVKLNEDLMKNYLALIPKLKEKGADLSPDMGKIESLYQYKQVEGIIKENGFKDLNDFVMTHTKVVYGFVASEMKEQSTEQKLEDAQAEGIKAIEKALNDPNTPADQKKILEMTMEQLKANGQGTSTLKSILDSYGQMVSAGEIELVQKYKTELKKIYEQK